MFLTIVFFFFLCVQGVALIPFLNEARLLAAMKDLNPTFDAREVRAGAVLCLATCSTCMPTTHSGCLCSVRLSLRAFDTHFLCDAIFISIVGLLTGFSHCLDVKVGINMGWLCDMKFIA